MRKLNSTLSQFCLISLFILRFNNYIAITNTSNKIINNPNARNASGVIFTENKGQIHDQYNHARPDVLFGGTDGNLAFHLKKNGISYQLNKIESWKEVEDEHTKITRKKIDKYTIYRLDVAWLNTNINSKIIKGNAFEGFDNYYLENCPNGALNVKSFEEVTYQHIYNGIDLKWYQKDGHLKYDYMVAAGANYKNIQLQYSGAKSITLNSKGELIITTPLGNIIEQAPLVVQNNKTLMAKWLIKNKIVSFEIENLDSNLPFIIDPAVRSWGTYYGGTGGDQAASCTTDALGNVYMAGSSDSNIGLVIATLGAHQSTFGGNYDAFLVKFDTGGVRQWGTYYGGVDEEYATWCTTDASGSIYLTGYTSSNTGTVIATLGSHQTTQAGGYDGFLVKFNLSGIRQWGTYYGGSLYDRIFSCSVDATGDVYIAGSSGSNIGTVIASAGSHQPAHGGGPLDVFLAKFNSSGVRLWGTYYGGTGDDNVGYCCTDMSGNVYLVGYTDATTGTAIATLGSHQSTYGGGSYDGFLAKFNTNGIRQWGTYYGGIGYDLTYACTTNSSGDIYITGRTQSNVGTTIATPGSHQTTMGGMDDGFLAKFNSGGIRQWGTYYGGTNNDYSSAISSDAAGNLFIGGYTSTSTGTAIATIGSHQPLYGGGARDAFLAKFDPLGVRQWGTYYGGTNNDQTYASTNGPNGNVYFAGYTDSNTGTIIATPASHQSIQGGSSDAFLVKFSDCSVPTNPLGSNQSICTTNSATLSATSGSAAINWFTTPTSTTVIGTGSTYITPTLTIGSYTYYAEAFTCVSSVSRTAITITVNALPLVTANSNNSTICKGETATLTASGASTYLWSTLATTSVIVVSPTITTNYTVSGTDMNGCLNTATLTQNVSDCTHLNSLVAKSSSIKIYPNPSNDIFTISGIEENTYIHIFNSIGELIITTQSTSTNSKIDLSNYSNGIYFIRIKNNTGEAVQKLIKQ